MGIASRGREQEDTLSFQGELEPERGTEPGTSHTKSQQGLRIHGCGVPRSPGRPTACPPAQQSGTLLYEYAQPYTQCKVNVFSPVTAFTSVNGAAIACAGATRQLLIAGIRYHGAAAFYRYFTRF